MPLSVLYLLVLICIRDLMCVTDQVEIDSETEEDYIDDEVEVGLENSQEPVNLIKCRQYHEKKKILGGRYALSGEFPHMAALGYGEPNNITWKCGGSLISEEFVLTAAHCFKEPVRLVRLGDIDLKITSDDAHVQSFTIKQKYLHPLFKPPSLYHDVALLQLDREINITKYVRPACLGITANFTDKEPVVAGWGFTRRGGNPSNILKTAPMKYVSSKRCNKTYRQGSRFLKYGFDDVSSICAEGRTDKIDTCQGDSGGPLQITNDFNDFGSFPEIVGITSFGKSCGRVAGVYTKVFYYVDWIKEVVWNTTIKEPL